MQLDIIIANTTDAKKPLAIAVDIDETVLSNSPYFGKQIQVDEDFSTSRWTEWIPQKKAKPIPGALHFLNEAKRKGVFVFYISNRAINQKNETIENLKLMEFPDTKTTQVLLKETISGKEPRRPQIQENYDIVLLIGDNLSDFSEVFDNRSTLEINTKVDSLKSLFGKKFIFLPNPMYGYWETNGILEGKYNWSNFQKVSIRHNKIKSY